MIYNLSNCNATIAVTSTWKDFMTMEQLLAARRDY